jgi:GTP-binding protein HflX
VFGKTAGLKANQQKRLQNLYRRKIPAHEIISREFARKLSAVSQEIQRQVAVLVNRKGQILYVVVGDNRRIWIPDLSATRIGAGRLKGLRCIHTHLKNEPLTQEDLTDLVLLALDLMVCILVDENGVPGPIYYANILPRDMDGDGWLVSKASNIGQLDVDFLGLIQSLESELGKTAEGRAVEKAERAILVGVNVGDRSDAGALLNELEALASSDDIDVVGKVVQYIKRPDARYLIGKGKLSELALRCLQTGSNLLIFNNELSPAQVKSLTDFTDIKIIDRSQLILDIFARRAVTREGKIQVELAQLKYLLPRLATKNTAMSRLTGGIGGRGPGETKLEINRRRVHSRIAKLNIELKRIKRQREERRRLRKTKGMPIISIVGYTNAGKSTLLNTLTNSRVGVGRRLFETLDPSSRRLRFPKEREAIITDTVGFIRNLPNDLMEAFAATLEELHDADLLLHVVDASSPILEDQITAVEGILERLGIHRIPVVLVINKVDLLDDETAKMLAHKTGGIAISAIQPNSLRALLEKIQDLIWQKSARCMVS